MARELNKAVPNTLLGLCLHDGARYNFLLGVTSTETIGSGHDPGREGQLPPKLLSHFPFRALDLPGIRILLSFLEPDTYSLSPTRQSPAQPQALGYSRSSGFRKQRSGLDTHTAGTWLTALWRWHRGKQDCSSSPRRGTPLRCSGFWPPVYSLKSLFGRTDKMNSPEKEDLEEVEAASPAMETCASVLDAMGREAWPFPKPNDSIPKTVSQHLGHVQQSTQQ